ncbi:hypothetical protein OC834_000892 [Tilletia horrida]|nr:hypothetical protein OC834_000892 [Tilletia horrida]
MKDGATAAAAGATAPIETSADRSTSSSGHSPRRAARRSSRGPSATAPTAADQTLLDEIESIVEEKDIPFAPPSLDYDADVAEIALNRAAAAAGSAFGGWHWAPLVIALAPPVGALLGGHADAWSDAILLLLGTFWLYQWMRVPWDMYALARTRRILQADEEEEDDEEDTTLSEQERGARQRARQYALTELQRTEYFALLGCMLSPFVGAYFLTWAQESLTDGQKYLNAFNIHLFTLAAGIRPWTHGVSLLRRRLLLLQEDVHYPSSRVENLKRKTKRLESDLSTLRKLVATKTDVSILREGIDLPLSQLSRAVRRNEKKEEHLRLSAEDKFALVEARLDDLLREVAFNAELIEEERRERERLAQMPLVHVVQAVKLLVGSRAASSSSYPNGRAAIGPATRPMAQIQASSGGGGSSNGSSRHYHQQPQHAPPGSYSQSRAYMQQQQQQQQQQQYPGDSGSHGGGPGQVYGHSSYHSVPGPISPPASVRSPTAESHEPAWYAKGPMYYMFFPLNISNAALSYAQSKVSSLLEDATTSPPPSSYPYPGSPTYGSGGASYHAHPSFSGLSSAPSKTRLGKKKQVKI